MIVGILEIVREMLGGDIVDSEVDEVLPGGAGRMEETTVFSLFLLPSLFFVHLYRLVEPCSLIRLVSVYH